MLVINFLFYCIVIERGGPFSLFSQGIVVCLDGCDHIVMKYLLLSGNLYSRQIQLDGETLAIQVQDTPGIQVRNISVHPFD